MVFFRVGRRACGGGESMRDISKRSIVITNFGAACVRKKSAAGGNEGEEWLVNR